MSQREQSEANNSEPHPIGDYLDLGIEEFNVRESEEVRELALKIATAGMCSWPLNHHRSVISAAALYLSLGIHNQKKSQEEIADAVGVSTLSLRKASKAMRSRSVKLAVRDARERKKPILPLISRGAR